MDSHPRHLAFSFHAPPEAELVLLQTCADNAEATALRMLLADPVLIPLIPLVTLWLPFAEPTWSRHIREGDEAFEARAYPQSEAAYRLADATARST